MDVEGPPTEITPSNSSGGNNGNTNSGVNKDVNNPAAFGLPYNNDLVVHSNVSSGQRIKLQVEINSDYKFLTICDPASSLADLKTQLELEYAELYPSEMPIVIVRLQDSRRNDMPLRFKISDLLRDKDKVYIVMKPIISEDDGGEASTPAPRQRGRKRKNMDKDIKVAPDTPSKKLLFSSLSPTSQLLPFQHIPSQPTTPTHHTQIPHQLQQQQISPQIGQIPPYSSPSAKVPQSQNAERVFCTPYCALIDTRENVPCTNCGELRPYVVPDSEKTDRNQCSKWCVTGSTRKLKAAGLEFCSICLARHRAGKYDLRKAHQCILCHRPWLHLDEYMYCRTCRKSAMGTEKEPPPQIPAPIILNNPLSLLTGNGAPPMHLSQQHLAHHSSPLTPSHHLSPHHTTHHQQSPLLTHTRIHSPPPHHISLHDLHKRPEHDTKLKGEQKTQQQQQQQQQQQSIPLQHLHHFQQQSQQLLGVNSPQHHSSPSSKDDKDDDAHAHGHHHHTQEHHHDAHHEEHVPEHPGHSHAEHVPEHAVHAHAQDPHSAEHLAEMVLSQIPGAAGQEGETPLGNSYYDPTIPISSQEKVGS